VSYIAAAGLERLPLDFRGPAPFTLTVSVTVDGVPVPVPAGIGVDRLGAEQAPLHSHVGGKVHVETRTADARRASTSSSPCGVCATTRAASVTPAAA